MLSVCCYWNKHTSTCLFFTYKHWSLFCSPQPDNRQCNFPSDTVAFPESSLTICRMIVWLGGVMVRALHLHLKRSRIWVPAILLADNNLGQVVHACASVTKQYNVVPVNSSDALRLQRSGISLTMRQRVLQTRGLWKKDEHPTRTYARLLL